MALDTGQLVNRPTYAFFVRTVYDDDMQVYISTAARPWVWGSRSPQSQHLQMTFRTGFKQTDSTLTRPSEFDALTPPHCSFSANLRPLRSRLVPIPFSLRLRSATLVFTSMLTGRCGIEHVTDLCGLLYRASPDPKHSTVAATHRVAVVGRPRG
jgi:hypothetical protein